MRATYISACIVGALVAIWLATGQLGDEPEPTARNIAEQNQRVDLLREERPRTKVRVSTIHATPQQRVLSVRGRTQSKRSVVVQSQIDGLLLERPVERGDTVDEGDLLCRVSVENRKASLLEARADVEQARIEFEGSQKLARQGLQSETAIAQAKARLASAKADLERARLATNRLEIRAPFHGVIEEVHLEKGQYVTPGSPCVTLVDLDPMLMTGNVTENELQYVRFCRRVSGLGARLHLWPERQTIKPEPTQ
jgi:multidrug efflux system membrane fusion protein